MRWPKGVLHYLVKMPVQRVITVGLQKAAGHHEVAELPIDLGHGEGGQLRHQPGSALTGVHDGVGFQQHLAGDPKIVGLEQHMG